MKTCPVCQALCFDDMAVCFGCMHRFEDGEGGQPGASAQPRAVQPRAVQPGASAQPQAVQPHAVQPRAVQPHVDSRNVPPVDMQPTVPSQPDGFAVQEAEDAHAFARHTADERPRGRHEKGVGSEKRRLQAAMGYPLTGASALPAELVLDGMRFSWW